MHDRANRAKAWLISHGSNLYQIPLTGTCGNQRDSVAPGSERSGWFVIGSCHRDVVLAAYILDLCSVGSTMVQRCRTRAAGGPLVPASVPCTWAALGWFWCDLCTIPFVSASEEQR